MVRAISDNAYKLRDAFGYLLEGEIEFLQELANRLPVCSLIINIGAGAGTSCLAFLEARPDLAVITIDIQAGGIASSGAGSLQGEENALRAAGLWDPQRIRQILGDSKDVGRRWTMPVEMVFVDGDHSYDGCRGDIEAWAPHIVPSGFLVLHDHQSPWWGDVIRAVDDTIRNDPSWQQVGRQNTVIAFQRLGP